MRVPLLSRPVRMRPADSADADFYLAEEVSKPRACLSAGRITVWVYREAGALREIVLAGHAESRTCSSATSIIIDAAKRLSAGTQWMLTCGAAYFRLPPALASGPALPLPGLMPGLAGAPFGGADALAALRRALMTPQAGGDTDVLGRMVYELQHLAGDTGLVEVVEQDWRELEQFRQRFRGRIGAMPAQVVLPHPQSPGRVADYVPIIPGSDPDGEPFVFTLEGWDFDCPAFQAVADRHLHKVRRELLRDALRRRLTYRTWLHDWMETWAMMVKWLPEAEACEAKLSVPPPADQADAAPEAVDVMGFLEGHAEQFIDRVQTWPEELAYVYTQKSFGVKPANVDLERQMVPEEVTEVDFERGRVTKREGTAEDAYTFRQRIMQHMPGLIHTCLTYIRRMDAIIQPYRDLRLWQKVSRGEAAEHADEGEREARVVGDVSRQIVIETMIRGWPSFYMDDKDDRAAFDGWAARYRPHVWAVMARQARRAGVPLELLLEDNIIYDVRFNKQLGCTVKPLMLVDDGAHAQVHGRRCRASAVVPLWPRRQEKPVPAQVLSLGSDNTERAQALVDQARRHASDPKPNVEQAARCMGLALACQPAVAGRLILEEWERRLGRDTTEEFERARHVVHAGELCARFQFASARPHIDTYLQMEPHPARDALVMAAICALEPPEEALRDLRGVVARHGKLRDRLKEMIGEDPAEVSPEKLYLVATQQPDLRPLLERLGTLGRKARSAEEMAKHSEQHRRGLIEKALAHPASVEFECRALARAAQEAPEELRSVLATGCLYRPGRSQEMYRRYGAVSTVVELQALLDIVHELATILYRVEKFGDQARQDATGQMEELAHAAWLPVEVEADLQVAAEEFAKGEWDRLLAGRIGGILREAVSSCLARMQDRMADTALRAAPMAQTIATCIHVTQTMEGRYRRALDMLLGARVALGRATDAPWEVLDDETEKMPEGGRPQFEPASGTVSLVAEKSHPLLRAQRLSAPEAEYVAGIFADPDLSARLGHLAPSLAQNILALEVEPRRQWQLWRDAMARVQDELLLVLANFTYSACLLPDHAPPKSETGEALERRMDNLRPLDTPVMDRTWQDADGWHGLLPRGARRVREDQSD